MGGLLQLGDMTISRKFAGPNPTPSVTKTAVLKLQIHRDQLQIAWEDFIQAPLKYVIKEMPALTLCNGDHCGSDCPKSHKAIDEEVEQIILEVWSRAFYKALGGKASPELADIYQCYIRVPSSALQGIIEFMVPGCYLEPRPDGVKGAHPDFCVVWLPRSTYQAAQHACRTCPQALSLVRFRDRYGVRIAAKDEQKAWDLLWPNETYSDLRVAEVYEISPVPHGATKTQVQEILQAWGWNAKPLQMGRGTKEYSVWKVGSDGPPPSRVQRGFDRDILINPIKQPKIQNVSIQPMLRGRPKHTSSKVHRAPLQIPGNMEKTLGPDIKPLQQPNRRKTAPTWTPCRGT